MALLEVRGLVKHYPIERGAVLRHVTGHVKAVDGVSFELQRGETLGIVGESGCGKSTLARLLLRLEKPTAGEALLEGRNIFAMHGAELKQLRRNFQLVMHSWSSAAFPDDLKMIQDEEVSAAMLADSELRVSPFLHRARRPRAAEIVATYQKDWSGVAACPVPDRAVSRSSRSPFLADQDGPRVCHKMPNITLVAYRSAAKILLPRCAGYVAYDRAAWGDRRGRAAQASAALLEDRVA